MREGLAIAINLALHLVLIGWAIYVVLAAASV